MKTRKVKKVITGTKTQDGAGVKLTRVISKPDIYDFDPFLLLDAFDSKNPDDYTKGFPWHPHRGIETITYLVSGNIEHGDSLGNKGNITDGSCQWMTAGRGIIHQEMPLASKHMQGAQIWLNLPQKDKMTKPAYHDIKPNMIPKVEEDGCKIAIISGSYKQTKAPTQGEFVKATYLDINLAKKKTWKVETPSDNTTFIYIISGSLTIDNQSYDEKRAILFDNGDHISVTANDDGARFLFLNAQPIKEPIAWGGPIVMNTKEELMLAFKQIDEGTFEKDCNKAHQNYYK